MEHSDRFSAYATLPISSISRYAFLRSMPAALRHFRRARDYLFFVGYRHRFIARPLEFLSFRRSESGSCRVLSSAVLIVSVYFDCWSLISCDLIWMPTERWFRRLDVAVVRFGIQWLLGVDRKWGGDGSDRFKELIMSVDGEDTRWMCGTSGMVNLHRVSSIVREIGEPCLYHSPAKVGLG